MTLYLNGTNGISGVDGSAGTPAIQGTDANTGVLFPAADTWAVAVGGVEKIRVQSSGMSGCITAGTSVASTSGTSIDFTGIPSWVKRITVMFEGVSTNGTSKIIVQLGTPVGLATSGYAGGASIVNGTNTCSTEASASGFGTFYNVASDVRYGTISCLNISGNKWVAHGVLAVSLGFNVYTSGAIALSGTLDRVRITTVNGTDTFDAGTINILYEG